MNIFFPYRSILIAICVVVLCSGCTGYSSVGVSHSNYWEPYRGYPPRIHYNYNTYRSDRRYHKKHHDRRVGRPHHRKVKGTRRDRPKRHPSGHRRR